MPNMIRIDEEVSDNRRDTHPASIVRDYSISSKDRAATQTQSNVSEHEQQSQNIESFPEVATSSWGSTSVTSGNKKIM